MEILIISFLAFIRLSSAENIFCASLGGQKLSGGVCDQPILHGATRYAYNKDIRSCQAFIPGCATNANNFGSMNECQQSCGAGPNRLPAGGAEKLALVSVVPEFCMLPLEQGKCTGNWPKYGYDPVKGRCVKFTYGGCMGNDNNFDTKQECESLCGAQAMPGGAQTMPGGAEKLALVSVVPQFCMLPLEQGKCTGNWPKYGYDPVKGRCVKFTYGGCMGNDNNFDTKQECESLCGAQAMPGRAQTMPDVSIICELPLETGKCTARYIKYGYDPLEEKCVEFIYGGCHGNANRFDTKQQCENMCRFN